MQDDQVQKARIASPMRDRDGTEIVDIANYAPFLLNAVSNAWGRKTSTIYRRDFGLGITDWRVISMLNIEPGITASRICDVIRLDKAAASRSLKTLMQKKTYSGMSSPRMIRASVYGICRRRG